MWLAVCVVTATSDPVQLLQDPAGRAEGVRDLLDAGRYTEAEAAARRLFPASDSGTIDRSADLSAGDLLVEALERNGRGATHELANLQSRSFALNRNCSVRLIRPLHLACATSETFCSTLASMARPSSGLEGPWPCASAPMQLTRRMSLTTSSISLER